MPRALQTLWDLLGLAPEPKIKLPAHPKTNQKAHQKPAPTRAKPAPATPPATKAARKKPTNKSNATPADSMQARYDAVTQSMLKLYGVRVRKWRTSMSGIAWQLTYRDGTISRLIEAPRPKGPMSAAVFLHEIGHHAIGFNVYKPRCLEEYHAWAFAIREMEANNLNVTDAVRKRMHLSLKYAVDKARRRGLKQLPAELEPYLKPWQPPAPTTLAPTRLARAASSRPPSR